MDRILLTICCLAMRILGRFGGCADVKIGLPSRMVTQIDSFFG